MTAAVNAAATTVSAAAAVRPTAATAVRPTAAGCPSLESHRLIGTLFSQITFLTFPENLDRAKRNDAGYFVSFQTDGLLVDLDDGAGQLSAGDQFHDYFTAFIILQLLVHDITPFL
jgi:hypothetical protein